MNISRGDWTRCCVYRIKLGLGLMSFVCLTFYWLALTDIWHGTGRPDFWHGDGVAAFEWRWLSILFWPTLVFHEVFLVGAIAGLVRSRS